MSCTPRKEEKEPPDRPRPKRKLTPLELYQLSTIFGKNSPLKEELKASRERSPDPIRERSAYDDVPEGEIEFPFPKKSTTSYHLLKELAPEKFAKEKEKEAKRKAGSFESKGSSDPAGIPKSLDQRDVNNIKVKKSSPDLEEWKKWSSEVDKKISVLQHEQRRKGQEKWKHSSVLTNVEEEDQDKETAGSIAKSSSDPVGVPGSEIFEPEGPQSLFETEPDIGRVEENHLLEEEDTLITESEVSLEPMSEDESEQSVQDLEICSINGNILSSDGIQGREESRQDTRLKNVSEVKNDREEDGTAMSRPARVMEKRKKSAPERELIGPANVPGPPKSQHPEVKIGGFRRRRKRKVQGSVSQNSSRGVKNLKRDFAMSEMRTFVTDRKEKKRHKKRRSRKTRRAFYDSRRPKKGPDKSLFEDPIIITEGPRNGLDRIRSGKLWMKKCNFFRLQPARGGSQPTRDRSKHFEAGSWINGSSKKSGRSRRGKVVDKHQEPQFDARRPRKGPDKVHRIIWRQHRRRVFDSRRPKKGPDKGAKVKKVVIQPKRL